MTNDADNVAQNAIIRTKAVQYGVLTFDSYTPFKDYTTLTAMGMQGDGTHVSTNADLYRGLLLMRDLGLFALARRSPLDPSSANAYLSNSLVMGADETLPNATRQVSGNSDVRDLVRRWFDVYDMAGNQLARLAAVSGSDPWMQQFTRFGGSAYTGVKGTSDGQVLEIGNASGLGGIPQWSYIRARARLALKTVAAASSGAIVFSLLTGDPLIATLNGNCTSSSITNLYTDGQIVTIGFRQDATGGRTYVWPTNCRFAGGVAPSDTTLNTQTTVEFMYDDTNSKFMERHRAVAVPIT